jgi:FkbM family methyltransferase
MSEASPSTIPVLGLLRRRLHAISAPRTGAAASQQRLLARWGFTPAGEGVWEKPPATFRAAEEAGLLAYPGEVEILDGDSAYRYFCSSVQEFKRAAGLLDHEAGTYAWLKRSLKSGDVVYDIGANIGLYTVVAGRGVGPGGRTYAFEPHGANVPSLLRNIELNDLNGIATVISTPLADTSGFEKFIYDSLGAGNGTSGLESARRGGGMENGEVKAVVSVDDLLAQGVIEPASLVKVDLKGVPAVLRGMSGLLQSNRPPRSLQIEVAPHDETAILETMGASGYSATDEHVSTLGQKRASVGESYVRNVIFER